MTKPQAPARQGKHLLLKAALSCAALAVAGYSLVNYLPPAWGSPRGDIPPLGNAHHRPVVLAVHAIGGAIALLSGVWQIVRVPRRSHRWIGLLYVVAVTVSGGASLVLVPTSEGGLPVASGFALLAVLWWATTGHGLVAGIRRDFAAHRRAMVRSFALTSAGVTLRLQLPLALVIGFEFSEAYPWIAWTCWVPNLVIAELWLRRS
jgi:hypothetical protein